MANLAASAVTIEKAWTEGDVSGKRVSARQVTLVLTAQGTVANAIPVSVLQLSVLEQAGPFVSDDNTKIYLGVPTYDGSQLLLMNPAVVTDADRVKPADITATIRGIVKGYL